MASPQLKMSIVITIFLYIYAIFPSGSVGRRVSYIEVEKKMTDKYEKTEMEMKLALGSRPPDCANKCMNCKPCNAATVVVPPQGDEHYYLLVWKCKCNDKLFPP